MTVILFQETDIEKQALSRTEVQMFKAIAPFKTQSYNF